MESGRLAPELRALVGEVRLLSPWEIEVAGERFPVHGRASPNLAGPRPLLATDGDPRRRRQPGQRRVEELSRALYRIYLRAPGVRGRAGTAIETRRHLTRLSLANRGSGTWDPGWRIHHRSADGRVAVTRDGVTLFLDPDEVRGPGGSRPGNGPCSIRVGKEERAGVPGFYLVLGDEPLAEDGDPVSLRLYWHLRGPRRSRHGDGGDADDAGDGATVFVHTLTTELNRRRIPFRAKVLSDPESYVRADAGILCLRRQDYEPSREGLALLYDAVREDLEDAVPMLTRRLAPGVGLAEAPAGGESFGLHRCRLVAEALWRAFDVGATTAQEREVAVARVFHAAGVDPERPHREVGSQLRYPRLAPPAPRPIRGGTPRLTLEESLLAQSRRIGLRLARQALWHCAACNWLGRDWRQDPAQRGRGPCEITSPLDPGLYSGGAGIGLFLAQLYARVGEPVLAVTARGAIEGSLKSLEVNPSRLPALGYFGGRSGVAYAARRIGALLGDEELRRRGNALLTDLVPPLDPCPPADLMTGLSGTILVLLEAHGDPGAPRALARAIAFGEALLRTAIQRRGAWSWAHPAGGQALGSRLATGLAHGNSGMALALLELYRETRRGSFLAGARGAFRYEDPLFSVEKGFHSRLPTSHVHGDFPHPFPGFAWCHGAPGIALARLRAQRLHPEARDEYQRTGRIALDLARKRLHQSATDSLTDTSLCHGISGLLEVVRLCDRMQGGSTLSASVRRASRALLQRLAVDGDGPSGLPDRSRHPSLLLGEAGVGYLLLELADCGVPSLFLPHLKLLSDGQAEERVALP